VRAEILFGTFNPGKLQEVRALISNAFLLRHCGEFKELGEAQETGSTLAENALIKARTYHNATGLPCFADDTGLEVDALSGAPGVNTAFYAGPKKDASANMEKLLLDLSKHTSRAAQFRTVIAFVAAPAIELLFEGTLYGTIATTPRGTQGFGFDPVFEVPALGMTLAELSLEQKNAYSHRARALQKLSEYLTSVY